MKPSIAGWLALGLLAGIGSLWAQNPKTAPRVKPQATDFSQAETPRKPLPDWLKSANGKQAFIDQGQHDPRLKGLLTPEGVKVEIVADFPTVMNPVGMTFADDGTPFVLEWLPGGTHWNEFAETITYKDGSTRKVATMKKPVKDVVKVLRDSKGTGVYDEARVILEDELPSSILLHDGWLYLSGRGTVRRWKLAEVLNRKADAPQPKPQIVAQGFCGFHHHQVSGLTIGNDGWLYITSGDDDNYVEGSDGSRATALRTGAVFRCRPDGSKMHVYSIGYRNPYRDIAFDAGFNAFHVDNDNEDGSKFMGCRLMHVAEESDFGWRLYTGARCCRPDPVRGAVYGELPGKLPPLAKTGRGAPAGLLIYNESRFPANYRGLLFYPDVFRKLVRAYTVAPHDSTFVLTHEFEFMKSDDPLFRPCQMVVGPDGAMYVVDWRTDSGGAGQLAGDGKHGRIYRVTWAGTADEPAIASRGKDSWAKLAALAPADLLKALNSPDFSDRLRAQQLLVKKGGNEIRTALLDLVDESKAPLPARVAALGALDQMWNDEVQDEFLQLLYDGQPAIRRLAAEGLGLNTKRGDFKVDNALLQVMGDQDLAVRRAVILAVGRIAGPSAADSLVNNFQANKEDDPYLVDALLRAIERLGKPGIDRLMALALSGVDKEFTRVVEAFRTLRTREAADAIPQLLDYPHLTIPQRVNLIRAYSNFVLDPPVSLEPVIKYLNAHQDEAMPVKLAALELLTLPGQPRKEIADSLAIELLAQTDPAFRLTVIRTIELGKLSKAAPKLAQLLAEAERPLDERVAMLKALRVLGDKSAVAALKAIFSDEGRAEHRELLRLEALRTLAVLDPAAGQERAKAALEGKDKPAASELTGAIAILGATGPGARYVAEQFLAKKLPREFLPQVSEALRKHAGKDPELAKLLPEVMKGGLVVALDKAEIERIDKLVRSGGNAGRGKALYLNAKLLACINCHRLEGVGGSVGPDLSRLWETHSLEKLLGDIVDPNKEIKEGYQTYVATTKAGQVYTGLKILQNADEVVLRDSSGKDVHIATKDLDEVVLSKQSLMPDNVAGALSFDQFLDLVAFLKDRSAQESLRGMALDFWVAGPYAGPGLDAIVEAQPLPDLSKKYPADKEGMPRDWQLHQVEPNGLLNLKTLYNGEKAAVALTHVFSPRAQKVEMLLGGSDLKVFVNGKRVHESMEPAKPDQHRITVELKEGWNAVLVRVLPAGGSSGLFLRFTGTNDLKVAARPEGK